jgi:hypothetical protein
MEKSLSILEKFTGGTAATLIVCALQWYFRHNTAILSEYTKQYELVFGK